MPPKKQTQSKPANTYRENYMKNLNSRVQQQNKQMAIINSAKANTKAPRAIHNSTARNEYMKALQTQSKLNALYLKADPDRKAKLENPLWYQQQYASPINGMTGHEYANSLARSFDLDLDNSSDSDHEEFKYGNEDNYFNYSDQNFPQAYAQEPNIQMFEQTQKQSYASVVKEHAPEVKYYKASDNSKFISEMEAKSASRRADKLLNEKTELLNKINSLKIINNELRNEIILLQNKYCIEIYIKDKILVIEYEEMKIDEQINLLTNYLEIFTDDNKIINEQITSIKNIFC